MFLYPVLYIIYEYNFLNELSQRINIILLFSRAMAFAVENDVNFKSYIISSYLRYFCEALVPQYC